MAVTIQDEIIGMKIIEETVTTDRRYTCITSAEISGFICEWYPEMFENVASDEETYYRFIERAECMEHFSYQELEIEWLADNRPISQYSPYSVLAELYCYDSFEDMQKDFIVINDTAIDGFLVF